jgi:hypothetical protein
MEKDTEEAVVENAILQGVIDQKSMLLSKVQ